ncbi:Homoserine kinase [Liberibacter crescens BT-1]|uniref:Homoserine kinase n=1 Tax=Liberibacter crescens (strain BT-1) TaxID=1215343 RepID=L0EUH3_LIBCB|nr:homoserine kinase [Liberibacter crescens]AGA64011.1 Homoserine kinase [Liberibacter crescens BT-1]AMC12321.1 serine kinase [Liberibacter crescens]
MAVYTKISEDILKKFIREYNIGKLNSYKDILEGVENSNFLLKTSKGFFILTLYEKRIKEKDLPFFIGLMNYLYQNGLKCPQPLPRLDCKIYGNISERPANIFSFLKGISLHEPEVSHCKEIGAILAFMHKTAQNFNLNRKNELSLFGWKSIWEKCCLFDIESSMKNEINDLFGFLEKNWPQNLPQGIIHGDLFPDNVLFFENKFSGMIDFYFSCNDILAYDLAICINAWCFEKSGTYNINKANALIEGYNSRRIMNQQEREALPLLVQGAALRFFLTRLYDKLTIPDSAFVIKKDPLEYLEKLRFYKISSIKKYRFLNFETC